MSLRRFPRCLGKINMPEANSCLFDHKRLLEALVKQAGVHEGKWTLRANFGFIPGNFGPAVDKIAPGVAITIIEVGLIPASAGHPENLVIDAAIANPAPKPISKGTGARSLGH
jgi:hypothetical protein